MNPKIIPKNPLFESTEKQHPIIPVKQKPVKCTYYFSQDTVKKIEKARYYLMEKYNIKISRSKIMELAVDYVNKDMETNTTDSILVKHHTVK